MTEQRFFILKDEEFDDVLPCIRDRNSKIDDIYGHYKYDNLEEICNELNRLEKENEQLKSDNINQENIITVLRSEIADLKQIMKEVAELLSEEVDLFSDKATEHDINAYIELKELDNKDAYYMAISTKKAIQMLKELEE